MITKITKENEELLDKLYEGSAYTITGAGGDLQEWIDGYNNLLKQEGIGEVKEFYTFTGKLMNEAYGLSGPVAYQEDITFLAFPLDGLMSEPSITKLAMFKIRMGDRWFDDIVNNNADHLSEYLSTQYN